MNRAQLYIKLFVMVILLFDCQTEAPVDDPETLEFRECLVTTSDGLLEIATWNLRQFPVKNDLTINEFSKILTALECDVIAVQEVTTAEAFSSLLEKLPGWEGQLLEQGDLNLGFMFKTSEIVRTSGISTFFEDSLWAFPRSPVEISLEHKSGLTLTLINIHLKCCGGAENESRREKASRLLKMHLDDIHPDDTLILLGDFNDEIYPSGADNVFQNFIDDGDHYSFADMDIASGSQVQWSYPFYPSHIDHILITDELFGTVNNTQTLIFDVCDNQYFNVISDHRPVLISIEKQ